MKVLIGQDVGLQVFIVFVFLSNFGFHHVRSFYTAQNRSLVMIYRELNIVSRLNIFNG